MAGKTLRTRESGLTLVELLISMAAMLIIIGALTTSFISQNKLSVSEEELIDLQMNLRVATDRLTQILAHAGFGCFDSFSDNTLTGNDPNAGSITISSFISNIDNYTSDGTTISNDSLIITYAFKSLGEIAQVLDEDKIELDKDPSPAITLDNNFKKYLSFFPNIEGNKFFQVSAIEGREISFVNPVEVSEGFGVFMVSPARIYLEDSNIRVQIFAYQDASLPSQHWTIAEDIEDLQLQYSLDGQTWWDDINSSDLQDVRKIRFWLLGKSPKALKDSSSQEIEITDLSENIGDTSQCVEEFEEDGVDYCVVYRVGPFTDGHARMLSRSEVTLRNAQ